ncbi:hypothetical protein B0T24DRAFT_677216 [Lasiosphaeria ovina]|uniref:Uncharacterized protein n=1 Tax=Lasiosphaeria ovina TaxID=92902 RepID=A0AAE0KI92_9PEZI|nr:hypothetical protein B0T24DRAFT_677216 [Lasiosphaeria ovina]
MRLLPAALLATLLGSHGASASALADSSPSQAALAGPQTTPQATLARRDYEELLDKDHMQTHNACDLPTIVGALGPYYPELKRYRTEGDWWVLQHLQELRDLWLACRGVPEIARPLERSTICTSLLGQVTTVNEGPRETGRAVGAAAALAVGGLLAVL